MENYLLNRDDEDINKWRRDCGDDLDEADHAGCPPASTVFINHDLLDRIQFGEADKVNETYFLLATTLCREVAHALHYQLKGWDEAKPRFGVGARPDLGRAFELAVFGTESARLQVSGT